MTGERARPLAALLLLAVLCALLLITSGRSTDRPRAAAPAPTVPAQAVLVGSLLASKPDDRQRAPGTGPVRPSGGPGPLHAALSGTSTASIAVHHEATTITRPARPARPVQQVRPNPPRPGHVAPDTPTVQHPQPVRSLTVTTARTHGTRAEPARGHGHPHGVARGWLHRLGQQLQHELARGLGHGLAHGNRGKPGKGASHAPGHGKRGHDNHRSGKHGHGKHGTGKHGTGHSGHGRH